ncbi:hypothetical protein PTW77_003485 [Salmonella enterica]|nr:hypothetical protein [Salmonella enterica]
MFTVKRVIDGDRIITEHEKVRIGDRKSRVFREALKMLENVRFDIVVGDEKLALNPGLKRVAPDVPDPNTMHLSDYCSWQQRLSTSQLYAHVYLRQLFPNLIIPDLETVEVFNCNAREFISYVLDNKGNAILVLATNLCEPEAMDSICGELVGFGTPLEKLGWYKPSPDSDMAIIVYTQEELQQVELEPGSSIEFTDVQEQSQWVNGECVVTVLKGARPGDRSVDELIGAMCIEEESGYDPDNQISAGALYELFYKGDEVYVVNSHGKTTDVLR